MAGRIKKKLTLPFIIAVYVYHWLNFNTSSQTLQCSAYYAASNGSNAHLDRYDFVELQGYKTGKNRSVVNTIGINVTGAYVTLTILQI